ncbi:MAG: hypothetical protein IPL90_05405 [Holophagales bacterium]|nr:hypothetical protein [Holophagales bacterium]
MACVKRSASLTWSCRFPCSIADHLLVDPDRAAEVVLLEEVVGEDLVVALRLHPELLLDVELRELLVDVEARRVELVDLLVHRDRPDVEAVAGVELGDAQEIDDRFVVPAEPDVEVAGLVQDVDVVRGLVEDLDVVLQRGIDLPLLQRLLRRGDQGFPLGGHG